MSLIEKVLGGRNLIKNKNLSLEVEATRMSGEMCTSLGNGWSNLMFNLFMAEEKGSEIVGVVEGDDGLFRVDGPIASADDFAKLGLNVKLEEHDRVETASFCGQIFDPHSLVVICDPRKVLNSVGWLDAEYVGARRGKQLGLLRAKAWSFGYQYPECPIVSAMARAILRLTRGHDQRVVLKGRNLDSYHRAQYEAIFREQRPELDKPIRPGTRDLMETVYGITPLDQMRVEKFFDDMEDIVQIPNFFPNDSWSAYAQKYVVETSPNKYMSLPPENWPKVFEWVLPPELDPAPD